MSENDEMDVKPRFLQLNIIGADGAVATFEVSQNVPLSKLVDTYCDRAGLDKAELRFLVDGARFSQEDTPRSLDMEDGDNIEVEKYTDGGSTY